ncbi:MAG: T9SS type A sorting domain-containing protein [Bacteroidota bacterium]|nr:T9SS type A sorting domain-containing protein [Bacteroidota bacterium]
MKRTSLYLLVTFFWMLMLRALLLAQPLQAQSLQAQSLPQVEHTQGMHQYIVREAFALLQRERPGLAMKLADHIGEGQAGERPWQLATVLAGTYREDCEDIVYGHGGSERALWPQIEINTPGPCMEEIYDRFRNELLAHEDIAAGLVTISHFWDPDAQDNYVGKDGIAVSATGLLSCLSTPNQTVTIKVQVNAWDKMQKLARPNGTAIRDYWWTALERMYDANSNLVCVLPAHDGSGRPMLLRYATLEELHNTGSCSIQLPGESVWRAVVLTEQQRKQYVWEIFGRMCHLLADMSVPAHTHKDMHMGNVVVEQEIEKLGISLGTVKLTVWDEDSYEGWVGNPVARFWTASMIRDGLIDLSGVGDPLHYLMSTMRSRAASFASDDFDGTGSYLGIPRYLAEIPDRHNASGRQIDYIKHGLLCAVRDNTLPYAIRATATLMAWFASRLDMPEHYVVRNVGTAGYDDFFVRDSFRDPFPVSGTLSGTSFSKQAGDELSLRAHTDPHVTTNAKFRFWKDDAKRTTTLHQFDDYVAENLKTAEADYEFAHTHNLPVLQDLDELGMPLHQVYPAFRNPWQVDKRYVDAWILPQQEMFGDYRPYPSPTYNGGLFFGCYDPAKPEHGYYSVRASNVLERASLAHKAGELEPGDYAFIDWEAIWAGMYDDPQNAQQPPHPAYPEPEQYDTKIVDFIQPGASVFAHYKAHRTAALQSPPTRSNSQRRVAGDDESVKHAVYESSGRIWYLRSSDGGSSWSGEMLVSDMGVQAARPSVAARGASAWISYVADGHVVLRVQTDRRWETVYRAPVAMSTQSAPVVAVLDSYEGARARGMVVCLVWEDDHVLKFAVLDGPNVLVDDQVLVRGHQRGSAVDQPRYPSIASSTMPYARPTFDHGFHIAWIENGSIYYCRLGIDRAVSPPLLQGWSAGGGAVTESVHASTGSVGALYPARHAPSITVTGKGTVHVSFDVVSSWSGWPQVGAGPGGLPSSFVLRERPLPTLLGPTWRTTTTVVSSNNNAAQLCSPSIAACPGSGTQGSKSSGLRIAYNDRPGMISVARLEGTLDIRAHEDGCDPSMTVWGSGPEELLDLYSIDAAHPYDWHVLSSRRNLAKTTDLTLLRQRQLLMKQGESIAALGLSAMRLSSATGDERQLAWDPAHDSLVAGIETPLQAKLRSARFTPMEGDHLCLTVERFAQRAEDANAEVLLSITDAHTDELLRSERWPVRGFASGEAVTTERIDLTTFRGLTLRVSAGVRMQGEEWDVAVVDRYAQVGEADVDVMEKAGGEAAARGPRLAQNHPNPFNPSTSISFTLFREAEVKLRVYNLLGRLVATLRDDVLPAGEHSVRFDAGALPTGVYIYRLEAGGQVQTRTMHLLK